MALITLLYAGLLGLIYLFLFRLVILQRRQVQAAFGDAGDRVLQSRIRAHGNFIEYVPLALLLMLLLELNGVGNIWLHGAGIVLVASRVIHAYGLLKAEQQNPPQLVYRITGMLLTVLLLFFASITAIALALMGSIG